MGTLEPPKKKENKPYNPIEKGQKKRSFKLARFGSKIMYNIFLGFWMNLT